MHNWGDKDVDWEGIGDAAYYIESFCNRYGRLEGQSKEKYGTVRFHANFGARSFLSITHPGYCHYGPYPKFMVHFDIYYAPAILKYTGITLLFSYIHPFVYNLAYQRALKKWPHLRTEILSGADYPELIKGVTRKEGNKLHILGWDNEIIATWTYGE